MIIVNNKLVAFIAEGNTEQAIIDVLLDHDALIYTRENVLQEEVIRCRIGKKFAKQYLNKSFGSKIHVYRILDSRVENFIVPKAYQPKISEITNLTTRPEIEMLFILLHNDYKKYTNGRYKKPSIFVKENYSDLKKVKSYEDNFQFWNSHYDDLIRVLKQYKSYHQNEATIADILR